MKTTILSIFVMVAALSFSDTTLDVSSTQAAQSTSSLGNELQSARSAIDQFLRASVAAECDSLAHCSAGLVRHRDYCPTDAHLEEYAVEYHVVPINRMANAILIWTRPCGGGNKIGQYFAIATGGEVELITDAEIGDMSFIAQGMSASDGVVSLYGSRWMPNDAHCCPSKEGTLEYDTRTKKHRFTGLTDVEPRN